MTTKKPKMISAPKKKQIKIKSPKNTKTDNSNMPMIAPQKMCKGGKKK